MNNDDASILQDLMNRAIVGRMFETRRRLESMLGNIHMVPWRTWIRPGVLHKCNLCNTDYIDQDTCEPEMILTADGHVVPLIDNPFGLEVEYGTDKIMVCNKCIENDTLVAEWVRGLR